jgi:hypothetical protein
VGKLRVEGADLIVELSTLEKAEAAYGDVTVLLTAAQDVRVVSDAWPELRGMRAPGTGIPGKIAVGTRRGSFGNDILVVAALHSALPNT